MRSGSARRVCAESEAVEEVLEEGCRRHVVFFFFFFAKESSLKFFSEAVFLSPSIRRLEIISDGTTPVARRALLSPPAALLQSTHRRQEVRPPSRAPECLSIPPPAAQSSTNLGAKVFSTFNVFSPGEDEMRPGLARARVHTCCVPAHEPSLTADATA